MTPDINDKFTKVGSTGTLIGLTSPKAIGASSISVDPPSNWPDDTAVIFAIRTVDDSGEPVPNTFTAWKGIVSGNTIGQLDLLTGSDQEYAANSLTQVFIPVLPEWANLIVDGLLVSHNQNGTLKNGAVTSGVIAALAVATSNIQAGAVTEAKLATDSVTTAKVTAHAVTPQKLTATYDADTRDDSGNITSATFQSYTGSAFTVDITTTQPNAVVEVNWSADLVYATGTGSCFGQIHYSGANSGTGKERQATNSAGSERVPASCTQIFVLPNAGTTTFELKCRGSSTAIAKHEDAVLSVKLLQD